MRTAALCVRIACAGAILQGCVIPTGHYKGPGYVPESAAQSLLNASRAEVLMRLGAPDVRYRGDRVFGYNWRESVAFIAFNPGYEVKENHKLLIEFNAQGQVIRQGVVRAVFQRELDAEVERWMGHIGRDKQ